MEITDKVMEQLAEYAKIELSKDEIDKFNKDLGELLDKIQVIKKVDTKGIKPMININSDTCVYRDDIVENTNVKENQDLALRNAPDKRDGFIVVPKILE